MGQSKALKHKPALSALCADLVCAVQVCMNCYLTLTESVEQCSEDKMRRPILRPAGAMMVESALEYFGIPEELWPPGIRMAKNYNNSRSLRQDHLKHYRKLMTEAVLVRSVHMVPAQVCIMSTIVYCWAFTACLALIEHDMRLSVLTMLAPMCSWQMMEAELVAKHAKGQSLMNMDCTEASFFFADHQDGTISVFSEATQKDNHGRFWNSKSTASSALRGLDGLEQDEMRRSAEVMQVSVEFCAYNFCTHGHPVEMRLYLTA